MPTTEDPKPLVDLYAGSCGLCYCSACTALPDRDAIEAEVNRVNPSGVSSPWKITDEAFASGAPNPHPCEEDGGRNHYLLVC